MSPAASSDRFRLHGRVKMVEGRWYAVVTITGIDGTELPATDYMGPEGGLATQDEALVYYYEKVRPALDEVAERARLAGGTAEKIGGPTLH